MSVILTCNTGSSNTKLAALDTVTFERKGHTVIRNNAAEMTEWLCSVGTLDIVAVAHRVVHGGQEFTQPTVITPRVISRLKSYASLAPLHQPPALKLIGEARKLYPDVPHLACFDTAFHNTMPDSERRLPLARSLHDAGIVRYGFHGLSYQHIANVLPKFAGERAQGRVIAVHLGGGSSACAMKNLKSVASTMGFSTLDGLMMGTRPGVLDPGVILYLLQQKKVPVKRLSDMLYQQSGLMGVSGLSGDMMALLENKSVAAQEAVELYCYLAAKQIASLLPALGGLDVLVFTGGIGENAASVRERIVDRLRFLSDFPVYVVPTDEERVMAEAYREMMTNKRCAA